MMWWMRWRWIAITAVPLTIGAVVGAILLFRSPPMPKPGPPVNAPTAIVSLGDSTISGEGAGNYQPGTNGENGDWCHRSSSAEVMLTEVPGVVQRINLACSGASSAQIGFGTRRHYTEESQAQQLTAVARQYRVVAVLVASGANDDPQFADTITRCVGDWLSSKDCFSGFDAEWHKRIGAMVPKVAAAITDIRTAMSRANYTSSDYQLVLQSYTAPLGPDVAPGLQDLDGCPLRTADLQWIRSTGVTGIDSGLRQVARTTGTSFLDLSRAGIGHEACSGGPDASREWFTRLTVDWQDLVNHNRAPHALQESFHPNARGYAQFARCLTEMLGAHIGAAACLPGPDGNLHAAVSPRSTP